MAILPFTFVTHHYTALNKDRINGKVITDAEFEVGLRKENTINILQLI